MESQRSDFKVSISKWNCIRIRNNHSHVRFVRSALLRFPALLCRLLVGRFLLLAFGKLGAAATSCCPGGRDGREKKGKNGTLSEISSASKGFWGEPLEAEKIWMKELANTP